ncbi:phage head morphogenesis protein [Alicyclobacillus sendaiensis]|uniref:phage head morphogenesis protein n=1 Tax=Alicyclobacillus sendaiensis TaxID=192387 RepID=UPI000B1D334F|nr:phage minor head protein [Alicyclobacillus sendaiensis]
MNEAWFVRYAEAAAMKMVTHLFTDAGRTWRQAAKVNSQGRMIYEALQRELQGPLGGAVVAQVRRNAELIRSVPADIAREMTEHIMRRSFEGLRASDIAQELLSLYPHISEVKANLIARTETNKTATALTQSRSEILGIRWYRWRTSEDARVRESHRIMDKVLVAWDDPPSPEELAHERSYGHYHAGCIFNCRCYPEPLIDLDFVQWPCKVYRNGAIRLMTRKEFEAIWSPSMAG